ncbi:hypothetical protein KR215_009951 [Drosophila sulfurigaster]|nr:hypothetical protein KR215_009951 [Drosophila sulfurigaster]
MMLLDILALERSNSYRHKRENRLDGEHNASSNFKAECLRKWQEKWDLSGKGRWTHALIPNIDKWVSRKFGFVNYHQTQILSGHDCFRSYLYRFGHESDPMCLWRHPEV